jgi:hypothetical protein
MDRVKSLRTVMQAGGVYCVIHAIFSVASALARYITLRLMDNPPVRAPSSVVLTEPLIYAAFLLIPGWFLLAKADSCAKAVAGMSKPLDEEEEDLYPASK